MHELIVAEMFVDFGHSHIIVLFQQVGRLSFQPKILLFSRIQSKQGSWNIVMGQYVDFFILVDLTPK